MAEAVEKSNRFHIVSDFPIIAYTNEMVEAIGLTEYAKSLWTNVKETDLRILTDLNTDTLFNHAFHTYGDPKLAYTEAEAIVQRLRTQSKTHKRLDIRYMSDPHGLDVAVCETKQPSETIIFTRDQHQHINGGIRIKSRETATNAVQSFERTYQKAVKITTKDGQEILAQTAQQIKNQYGIPA
jgi:hypothetical protein